MSGRPRDVLTGPRARLAAAVVATGLAAGAVGTGMAVLLHLVENAAFGYTEDTFLADVTHASPVRRVAALAVVGALVGVGWWLYRRLVTAPASVTAALAGKRPLTVRSAVPDALLQILAVGGGASLGRENAPRQVGAALGGWLADRLRLDADERRRLLACGAGAGFAAVYDVPLGGALFTLELLLVSAALVDVVPAVLTAAIAAAVSWTVLGTGASFPLAPAGLSAQLVVFAVLLGPLAALVGVGFARLAATARERAVRGWPIIVALPLAFAALAAIAAVYPALLGNGKALAGLALTGRLALAPAAALLVLKPLATALCLRAGAVGGLLTPSLSTGAVLGVVAGAGWAALWPGAAPAGYALVGAAAVLAITSHAPLTALVLTFELTHADWSLVVPVILAIGAATAIARLLPNGRSEVASGAAAPSVRRRRDRPAR